MTTDNARKGTTGATAPRDERTSSTLTPYERAQAASLEALTLGAEARDTVALFAARAANLRSLAILDLCATGRRGVQS